MTREKYIPMPGAGRLPQPLPFNYQRNLRATLQQRARTHRRAFRRVCGCLSFLSLLGVLCFVGRIEGGTIGLLPGGTGLFANVGLFGIFAKLAGGFE